MQLFFAKVESLILNTKTKNVARKLLESKNNKHKID